jgi:zinc transport system substrate-binding protein
MPVFVSVAPQRYFVERVGGPRVAVSVLLPAGQSPATYEPTPSQMARLSEARLYFRTGVPFEKRVVAKIEATLPDLPVVDLREGIDLRDMVAHHHEDPSSVGHEHGEEKGTDPHDVHADHGHEHAHGDKDPHVWLDPGLVKVQARTIRDQLSRLDSSHRDDYAGRCSAFESDLDRVDAEIALALAPLRGREFFVFHPAYGYFAAAYGLRQVAIEASGKQPSAKQLGALIDRAREAGVKLVFVQPQFDKSSAETIAAAIGAAVVRVDPLAEDYLENLRHIAAKTAEALGTGAAEED